MYAHDTTTEILGFTQPARNYHRSPSGRFDAWAGVRDCLDASYIDGFFLPRVRPPSSENHASCEGFALLLRNSFFTFRKFFRLPVVKPRGHRRGFGRYPAPTTFPCRSDGSLSQRETRCAFVR